jgi:hypothetical protein
MGFCLNFAAHFIIEHRYLSRYATICTLGSVQGGHISYSFESLRFEARSSCLQLRSSNSKLPPKGQPPLLRACKMFYARSVCLPACVHSHTMRVKCPMSESVSTCVQTNTFFRTKAGCEKLLTVASSATVPQSLVYSYSTAIQRFVPINHIPQTILVQQKKSVFTLRRENEKILLHLGIATSSAHTRGLPSHLYPSIAFPFFALLRHQHSARSFVLVLGNPSRANPSRANPSRIPIEHREQ